ncbi:MAG: hypothetical protein ABI539_13985 [Acidobacteriota bacterium]
MLYLKRTILIAVCLAVMTPTAIVLAQKTKDNLYSRGLKACLEKELVSYKDFSSRDLRNVFVLKDDKVTYGLPTQFGEIKVEYLTLDDLAQRYRERRAKTTKQERTEIQ